MSLSQEQKRFNELKALFVAKLRPKLNIPEMDRIHRDIAMGLMDAAIWSLDEKQPTTAELLESLEKENRDGDLRLARESIGIARRILRNTKIMGSELWPKIRNQAEQMVLTSNGIMETALEQIEQTQTRAA